MTQNDLSLKPVAPAWHTTLILGLLLIIAAVEVRMQSHPLLPPEYLTGRYFLGILFEWLLLGMVLFGLRFRNMRPRDLLGITPPGPAAFLRDLAIAIVFLIGCVISLAILRVALNGGHLPPPNQAVAKLLPRTPMQLGVFTLLSLSAGICEEMIFRGYLQRQFAALTNNAMIAVVIQALVFGLCHAYQGVESICLLSVYGLFLGLLRQWSGRLRPGILAHFMQDAGAGLVGYFLLR